MRSSLDRRPRRFLGLGLILLSGLGLAAAACTPTSYVVLELQAKETTPIRDVTVIVVDVLKGTTRMKSLTYSARGPRQIDMTTPVTLSVSFDGIETGAVAFMVKALASGCTVGTGEATAIINKGGVVEQPVLLAAPAVVTCGGDDGGAPDGGDAGVRYPGCDPVAPACGANMTCLVNCTTKRGECTPGGAGGPGTICRQNSDCMPGTQCFTYERTDGKGCAVKVCLRFCNSGAECTQPPATDGGAGAAPPSVCEGIVACDVVTSYHTCTFSCDPRNAASVAGTTGCPTGLACVVVGEPDQVDCACPNMRGTATTGAACVTGAECAPGFLCNGSPGSRVCNPICRCDAQGALCTATTNDCPGGTGCTPVSGDIKFGVCR